MNEMNLPSGLSCPLEICGFPKKSSRSSKGVSVRFFDLFTWQYPKLVTNQLANQRVSRFTAGAFFIERSPACKGTQSLRVMDSDGIARASHPVIPPQGPEGPSDSLQAT